MKAHYLLRIITVLISFVLPDCSGLPPNYIRKFAPCPDRPNCVSTRSLSPKHSIEPFKYKGQMEAAQKKLLSVIAGIPRTRIITKEKHFIHVEFISKIFRFVDDVEFYFDKKGIISFRSASRWGYSDLGVNRERMETIRNLLKLN